MAVAPRDAATVILARPTEDGSYEVLMTQRPETMKFMGGMHVFPGGALDESDCSPALEARSAIAPAVARDRIGEDIEPERALGLLCCGVRELFEEVGILLARDASGRPVEADRVRRDYAPRRTEFAEDGEAFGRFLASEGLTLATDALVWHGRLVTPEASPIRFDARFFVAPAPVEQHLALDEREVVDALWVSPPEALRGAGEQRLSIPIPTLAVLQGLSEVPSYEQLLRGVRVERDITTGDLSPLVSLVLAPNPGAMTGPGTNTYVVGRGETVIIDPAVPDGRYVDVLARKASERGHPVLIALTHMHPDHVGGATILAEQLGVPVAAWRGVADGMVTRGLDDGERVDVGGATLRALHTPGHASHHLCFLLEQEQAVFAGDVVAGIGTVVIAPPDGNMREYLDTLARLRALGVRRIYPGHGPVIEDGDGKLAEYVAHRGEREQQVLASLAAGDRTVPAMVARIYVDVPRALHPVAELSVLAHLEMLEGEGRVARDGSTWTRTG